MSHRLWWVPVAAAAGLGPAAPQRASVFGEELVLWRDAVGRAKAFTDRCPHRGARLSMGRVHEGRLILDGLDTTDGAYAHHVCRCLLWRQVRQLSVGQWTKSLRVHPIQYLGDV